MAKILAPWFPIKFQALQLKKQITAERLPIIIIMILAAFLRFWNFGSIPFMHDEFSAIFRTFYHSVYDVVEIGVKQNDSHPAGVQLFIYFWIKLFGLHEPLLKFPFALLGWGSVFVAWLIARRWFNNNTALFTAAFMAVTQYHIFYSQLARPYAPGLFFGLVTTWYWTKVVFDENTKLRHWVLFVLFTAINSYIHAFTLFFNVLMAATGLIFVRGEKFKHYLLAGLAILVLYLPGIPVFLAQLGRGDIGGWLAKPKPGFLIDFFRYLFHFSRWFFLTVITIITYLSIKYFNKKPAVNKFRLIGLGWFVVTFAVAFAYSVYRSPIIQYSTLLFVFPFLLMVFFSFFDNLPKWTRSLSITLIVFAGVFTLVFERMHYTEMYKQGFDQIPLHVIQDVNKYPTDEVAVVLQAPDTRMFDYYFEKYGQKPPFFKLENKNNLTEVNNYLRKQKADIVLFGCADYAPLEYLEALKTAYPYVLKRLAWFNSEYWVLSKRRLSSRYKYQKELTVLDSSGRFKIPEKNNYGAAIKLKDSLLRLKPNDVIFAKATIDSMQSAPEALLVLDWRDSKGKAVFWKASKFKNFFNTGPSFTVATSIRVRDLPDIPKTGRLKVYIWKKDGSVISVDNMEVVKTHIYPVEMGLYEPL